MNMGDHKLVVYATLTNVIQFFLMCNFLLAIIVDSFAAAGRDYEDCLVENAFFQDLLEVEWAYLNSLRFSWPQKARLLHVLDRIGRRNVTWLDIYIAGELHGVTPRAARSIVDFYGRYEYMESSRKKSQGHVAMCQLASDLQLPEPSVETFEKMDNLWAARETTLQRSMAQTIEATAEESRRHNAELYQRHIAALPQQQYAYAKTHTAHFDHVYNALRSVQGQLAELQAQHDSAARDSTMALFGHMQALQRQMSAATSRHQLPPMPNQLTAGASNLFLPSTLVSSTSLEAGNADRRVPAVAPSMEGTRAYNDHHGRTDYHLFPADAASTAPETTHITI